MSRTPIARAHHAIAAGIVVGSLLLLVGGSARARAAEETTPIQHVVIIDQENHSFDNLLGDLCVEVAHNQFVRPGSNDGCDGTTVGTLPGGKKIALATATDVVAGVHHSVASQQTSMDGGKMDGFARIGGCKATQSPAYRCYSQYHQKPDSECPT